MLFEYLDFVEVILMGGIIKGLGFISLFIFGIWGLLIDLSILYEVIGFWGIVIGIFVLPVTLIAAPWYALLAWGTWFPLIITYGGGLISYILIGIGSSLQEE